MRNDKDAVLPEFRAARAAWRKWRGDGDPSPETQREYGRQWRWYALWERVWDHWEDAGLAWGLAEFVTGLRRFWAPLRGLARDPVPYDPSIELEWEAALAGPNDLERWDAIVGETWSRMAAVSTAKEEPTVSKGSEAPVEEMVELVVEAEEPAASRPRSIGKPLMDYDPLLNEWRDDLLANGVSRSHADNLRRYVGRASARLGLPVTLITPDLPGVTVDERRAAKAWVAWLASRQERRRPLVAKAR
ncbi:conserved protein of unknown function [Candidatus Hydrogenisulfobacillus filiaventi]|uniref:Uncharacterized protein n=1 Tax=Candidatus Hydrogenisulfobacillus filiaventi TaxID=2707344 RepID=A0A6F8ZJ82_9FIRM|nr:conserved protein of unknown function [Candidatus Hydrogenisulfobacillus filiaventi]